MTGSSDLRYRAFLSYRRPDMAWANWFQRRIETFPLNGLAGHVTETGEIPKHLRPIFRDCKEFRAGAMLNDRTAAALDASAALIVLCSPAAANSGVVNEEIRLFRHRHPKRPIVPVIVAGEPCDNAPDCVPPALKFELNMDGRFTNRLPVSPVTADAREAGDGRELAFAKTVAGILGLPAEEVYRHAERKRRQKLIRGAVAAIILLLAAGAAYSRWPSDVPQQTPADIEALVNKYAPTGLVEADSFRERLRDAFEAIAAGTADPRYKQALDFIKAGKPQEAEPLLREALEEETAGLRYFKRAAVKYRHLGAIASIADPKTSRQYYARADELDPDNIAGIGQLAGSGKNAGSIVETSRPYNAVQSGGVNGWTGRAFFSATPRDWRKNAGAWKPARHVDSVSRPQRGVRPPHQNRFQQHRLAARSYSFVPAGRRVRRVTRPRPSRYVPRPQSRYCGPPQWGRYGVSRLAERFGCRPQVAQRYLRARRY